MSGHTHARLPYTGHRHTETVEGAPALAVQNLEVAYPGASRPALSGIDLTVSAGERIALVGGNGAGKSTLLKAVAGVLPARRGSVLVGGSPLGCCRHRVAYLPQHGDIEWDFPMTVGRLVLTGRYSRLGWLARPKANDRATATQALADVGLIELADRRINALSGGQRQRILLARALAAEPELLLLDEPLSALDQDARAAISATLSGLHADGVTMLVATHDLDALATDYDAAIHLVDGREVPIPATAP